MLEESKIKDPKSKIDYGLALLFFALGLMSKPMLVTWPFVMLLLDYWPLGRMADAEWQATPDRNLVSQPPILRSLGKGISSFWPLVREKIPFFALTLTVSVVTFMVQKQTGAMEAGERIPVQRAR